MTRRRQRPYRPDAVARTHRPRRPKLEAACEIVAGRGFERCELGWPSVQASQSERADAPESDVLRALQPRRDAVTVNSARQSYGRLTIHSRLRRSPPKVGWPGTACNNLRMHADKRVCGLEPDSQFVELAVEVFTMLADATRVRLIIALRDGEQSVNHLAGIVEKTPAAVSQHLAKLRLARFVTTRQEGTHVFYRLENEHASQLVSDAVFQAEHSLGDAPRHHHSRNEGVA
jgi:DNA-binding transcriptional ArsR family regulator